MKKSLDHTEMFVYVCVRKTIGIFGEQTLIRRSSINSLSFSALTLRDYIKKYLAWNYDENRLIRMEEIMCGILGGNEKKWDYENALKSIRYRGPDCQKIKRTPDFTMGFARLSIMDLSDKAMQPMQDSGKKVWITFNGEIYGYLRLRKKLEKAGYIFHSSSDTEVILNAYMEYGDSFISRIDGMFAIAIYDTRTQEIKLFRDRAGIKPLYYLLDDGYFAYASELKAIKKLCNNISLKTDGSAIYDYLTYTYIPDPKTMYHNVYKLPPACKLVYNLNKKKVTERIRYYDVAPNFTVARTRKKEDLEEELRELIHRSVEEQMVADVPVGSFLSGGVDSSIISREAALINPQIETFSIGFRDKRYDETLYADMVSHILHLKQNKKTVIERHIKELERKIVTWFDEPYADTSAYPSYLVSELAREKVTVVLTGDGSDELFGGYDRYQLIESVLKAGYSGLRLFSDCYEALCAKWKTLYSYETSFLEEVAAVVKYYGYKGKRDKREYAREFGIAKGYDDYWFFRKYYIKELPPITRLQYLDFHTYLPCDILTKVDRVSMQVSLEARVPFLSKDIMGFAFSLSQEERCSGHETKGLLKDAYKGIFPEEILFRKKKGFSIPAYYLSGNGLRQEKILHRMWNI